MLKRILSNKTKLAFLITLPLIFFLIEDVAHSERFVPKSDLIRSTIGYVQEKYVNPERIKPETMFVKALEQVAQNTAPVVVEHTKTKDGLKVKLQVDTQSTVMDFSRLKSISDLEYAMQKVARFIKKNVNEDEGKSKDIDYHLLNGMLSSLDPHTNLFPPENYDAFNTETKGSFGGVGMYIGMEDGQLMVISPIRGTPAAKAGLKSKDKIIRINDISTINITISEALNLLRGKIGTPVDIYIMREGFSSEKKFTVYREVIPIVSVASSQYEEKGKRLFYVNIKRFNKSTFDELNKELAEADYDLSDFKGFVVDLRDNPGGFLEQAIEIADKFLSSGVIVSTASYEKKTVTDYKAKSYNSIDKIPLIIIVNHGSASASEIYAGALKGNKRAVVIGERTFGKGSVQTIFELRDGFALKLTTSQYLTPGRKSIQVVGVASDVLLEPLNIEKDFIRIAKTDFTYGEGNFEQTIFEWSGEREEAKAELDYLYVQPREIEKEFINEISKEELEQDYAFKVARDVLFNYQNNEEYDNLLQNLLDYTEGENKNQQLKLVKALDKLGVDWKKLNTLDENQKKEIKFSHWVEVADDNDQWVVHKDKLISGHKYRINFQIKNESAVPIQRTYGIIESSNLRLNNRQVVFGNVQPKEKSSWYIPFELKKGITDMNFTVKLNVFDYKEKIDTFKFALRQKSETEPKISFRFESSKSESKNGKQPFNISVFLQNTGTVDTDELTVFLKNEEGKNIELIDARGSLKTLKTSQEQEMNFLLNLIKVPDDKDIDLTLNVLDVGYNSASLSQKIKVPLDSSEFVFSNSAPEISVEPYSLSTVKDQIVLKGKITDNRTVKDYYVFLNKHKILYTRLGDKKSDVSFNIPLKLNPGMNNVVIFSRDENNLAASKYLHILKKEDELVQAD